MATPKKLVPLPGSERRPLTGSRVMGPVDPNEKVLVTLRVRGRAPRGRVSALVNGLAARPPYMRRHLSRQEFASRYGANPADFEKVEAFAREHGLSVEDANTAQRRMVLSGTASAFSSAFGVHLDRYEHPRGSYRGRTGQVQLPEDLLPIVEGVFGLDNRPQATPHFRRAEQARGSVRPRQAGTAYTPIQMAQFYDFPTDLDGSGECIGIIELGGGYRVSDLNRYFSSLSLPTPTVKGVSVNGGANDPTGNPSGPDGEVMLDIEVAGGIAPGATFVVYFAPNTDAGFLDAIDVAVHDDANKPSVISISWGAAEKEWTVQAMQAMDEICEAAGALGVTVCCAAGDGGSDDGETDGLAHVDFPASSPHVLACGGTRLEGSRGTIESETVWNGGAGNGATGGGISDQFDLPAWQVHAKVPPSANPGARVGRGVPDVSGDADPATGYTVLADGQTFAVGGTSAVAPLWAGLVALLNEQLGSPAGFLNPLLYALAPDSGALNDITVGNNGAYTAGSGWDACTGLGSPDGVRLAAALQSG